MSRKAWPLILLILLVCMVSPAQSASAQKEVSPDTRLTASRDTLQSRRVTFVDLGYATDETFKGILVGRDFTVRWPDAWDIRPGNVLRLEFSHSPALHPSSSLVVDWNGTRLASTLLTSQNADHATLEVPIPETLIVPGYNRLRIELYMGIHDDFCQDEHNPALWTTVHNTSSFLFSYEDKQPAPDLSLYPVPFIDNSPLVENRVTLILPASPNQTELAALAAVSARLGEQAAWRPLQLDVLSAEQAAQGKPSGDLVYIGTPGRIAWPASQGLPFVGDAGGQTTFVDANRQAYPSDAGIVWEAASPYDSSAVLLLVTGSTDAGLLKAARALASTAAYPRFAGQLGVVLDLPQPDPTGSTPVSGRVFSLEALGYPDTTARGTWEQTIHYIFPVPYTWQTQSEAVFDLHFAHSDVLHPERSSLSVLLNGTPVGSLALKPANATDAHTTFRIPARLFQTGSNQLTITANLRMPDGYEDDFHCLDNTYPEAWVVVYADSLLRLPDDPAGPYISLEDYPSAFIGLANLSDLALVVPAAPDLTLAQAVASVAEGLGRSVSGCSGTESLAPGVIDPQALANGTAGVVYPHRFLIGLPTQNPAIARLNDRLPQPFQAGTDLPAPVESLARVVPPASAVGFVQAVLDDESVPILVVTGTTGPGVAWAAEALADPGQISRLRGDLAILDGPSRLVTAEVRFTAAQKIAAAIPPETPQAAALAPATWVVWLAGGIFLLAVLVLGIVIWIEIQRQQKSREYGTHSA
jgi:hypothetical protein